MTTRAITLLCVLTIFVLSAMAQGPTLNITPPSASLPQGTTQLFTASFSDGSHIKQCTWNATGTPPNSITDAGATNRTAVFGAGTAPGQYAVTAVCTNNQGVTATSSAPVTVTP